MTQIGTHLEDRLRALLPVDADYASARHVSERGLRLSVRNGVVEPSSTAHDEGVIFSIWRNGGVGYGATSGRSVVESVPLPHTVGEYTTPSVQPFAALSFGEQVAILDRVDQLGHCRRCRPRLRCVRLYPTWHDRTHLRG